MNTPASFNGIERLAKLSNPRRYRVFLRVKIVDYYHYPQLPGIAPQSDVDRMFMYSPILIPKIQRLYTYQGSQGNRLGTRSTKKTERPMHSLRPHLPSEALLEPNPKPIERTGASS